MVCLAGRGSSSTTARIWKALGGRGGSGRGRTSSARSGNMGEMERYGCILSVVGDLRGERGGEDGGGGGDEVVTEWVVDGEGDERGDEEQARGRERREERLEVGGEGRSRRPS